ncbi:MAG: LamG domain-containing protein, partial [Anaerolineales bacterium]|nr:LamG domain-containing protein [Anaerolineales bacterium]
MIFSRILRSFLLPTALLLSLKGPVQAGPADNQAALQLSAFTKPSSISTYTPPVSWWKGDGDASDSAGDHDGTLSGGVTFVAGASGSAFHLDGVDDYIEIPHHPELNPETGSFSVLVWVRPEEAYWNRIIMKGNLDPNDYYIAYNLGEIISSEIGGDSGRTGTAYYAAAAGQWYHLALVRDRSLNQVFLYVNGRLDQASQVAVDVTGSISNESPLAFGKNSTAPVEYFKGSIDEVKYYNYAVTAEQIQDEIISAYPQVISIDRASAALTNAASVDFTVTFSEEVGSVGLEDFTATGSVIGAALTGVTPLSASVYTVSVSTGSGDGTLGLDVPAGASITDLAELPLSNLPYTGSSYTLDKTVPTVLGITRADPNPTSADQVGFSVIFSEPVTGV